MKNGIVGVFLVVVFLVLPFLSAKALEGDDVFWSRYSGIYDTGKNFLEYTARGEGSVSEHNGAYLYKWDVPLPPGRNGMTPKLSLLYSSQGKRGYMGDGWEWNISKIQRSTKYGKPIYDITDHFEYTDTNGQTHFLIPFHDTPQRTFFRCMREGLFAYFKYDKTNDTWIVLMKNGHKLEFGNSEYEAKMFNDFGTSAWFLNEHKDTTGNSIQYDYYFYGVSKDFIRPAWIRYTVNENHSGSDWEPAVVVNFFCNMSPLPSLNNVYNCRSGHCVFDDAEQLDSLQVIVEKTLRKQFDFEYDILDNHKTLKSITPKAYSLSAVETVLPPITFSYEPSTAPIDGSPTSDLCLPAGSDEYVSDYATWGFTGSYYTSPQHDVKISDTVRLLIDMDGDGIKDLVHSFRATSGRTYVSVHVG